MAAAAGEMTEMRGMGESAAELQQLIAETVTRLGLVPREGGGEADGAKHAELQALVQRFETLLMYNQRAGGTAL